MKLTFLVIVFVSLIGMITPAVAKNGTIGIYAIVDHVTFEPSASAPDMVRIDGIFVIPVPWSSGAYMEAPQRGYLYFRLLPGMERRTQKDWAELQAVAGTGQVVGFADYWAPNPNDRYGNPHHSLEVRVHKDGENASPDVYPLPNRKGIVSRQGRARVRRDCGAASEDVTWRISPAADPLRQIFECTENARTTCPLRDTS